VFRKLTLTEDWKRDLQQNYWVDIYAGAGESKRRLEAEYAELRPLLTELGMAKQQ